MPLIVDPKNDVSNGVGNKFKSITIFLSISLPLSAILVTTLWSIKNGINKFF